MYLGQNYASAIIIKMVRDNMIHIVEWWLKRM